MQHLVGRIFYPCNREATAAGAFKKASWLPSWDYARGTYPFYPLPTMVACCCTHLSAAVQHAANLTRLSAEGGLASSRKDHIHSMPVERIGAAC